MKFIGVAIVWLWRVSRSVDGEGGRGKGEGGGGAYTSGEGVSLAASGGVLAGIFRLWMERLTLCHSILDVVHGVEEGSKSCAVPLGNLLLTRASELN